MNEVVSSPCPHCGLSVHSFMWLERIISNVFNAVCAVGCWHNK